MANLVIIRDLAEKQNITLRQLASKIGITESALQTLIRKGSTNTTTLESIANVLNVPVGCFFDEISNSISQNNVEGDNIQGKKFMVKKLDSEKLMDSLNKKDEQLSKSQEQIDRLIGIIEKLNNK